MNDPTETQSSPELARVAADLDIADIDRVAPGAPPHQAQKPAPQPAPQPVATLDQLLAEFDTGTAPQPEPWQPVAPKAPEAPPAAVDPLVEFNNWGDRRLLEQKVEHLTAEVDAARQFVDRLHFTEIERTIEKRLADSELAVPENYVKTALAAAAHDPQIVHAWDNRANDPRSFSRAMRKLQDQIFRDARSIPDRAVTEDRRAISAFMKGVSKLPEEKPPRYGDMNDADFAKEKAKYGL